MWNFVEIRECLIPLVEKLIGDVDKIVFAREYNVDQWTTPAYIQLCRRKKPLDSEEATKIGLEGTLLIFRIRESFAAHLNIHSSCSGGEKSEPGFGFSPPRRYGYLVSATLPKVHKTDSGIEEEINSWIKNGRTFNNRTK